MAGRSSLVQANRTAKQTLNHCDSDSRTVQCRRPSRSSVHRREFGSSIQSFYSGTRPSFRSRSSDRQLAATRSIHQPTRLRRISQKEVTSKLRSTDDLILRVCWFWRRCPFRPKRFCVAEAGTVQVREWCPTIVTVKTELDQLRLSSRSETLTRLFEHRRDLKHQHSKSRGATEAYLDTGSAPGRAPRFWLPRKRLVAAMGWG